MSEVEEVNERPAGGYSVSLPTFEGPLDLLLHLCQKHELDILDIPIAFVTEKYLEFLAVMTLMNLDVASEYLVMAATLAHIKSKMLLPAPPPGQEDDIGAEEEDPREALIRRLLEYQKYKHAGEELQARGVAGRDVFLRGAPIEDAVPTGLPPLAQVALFSLVEAFQGVLEKSKVKLTHDIVHERITLADRINELVDLLRGRRRLAFEDLFEGMTTRFDLVITFLALLEMTRLRMTRLFQADFDSQIYVEFSAQVTADDDPDETTDDSADETPTPEPAGEEPTDDVGEDAPAVPQVPAEVPSEIDVALAEMHGVEQKPVPPEQAPVRDDVPSDLLTASEDDPLPERVLEDAALGEPTKIPSDRPSSLDAVLAPDDDEPAPMSAPAPEELTPAPADAATTEPDDVPPLDDESNGDEPT